MFSVLHYPDPDVELPTAEFDNLVDALDEARRLCRTHGGDNFVLFPDTGELTRSRRRGPPSLS